MISAVSNNYSPNFKHFMIANNPQTKEAMKKCTPPVSQAIRHARFLLQKTNFVVGIIRKDGDKLVFRVRVPKGFEFAGIEDKQTFVKLENLPNINTNNIYQYISVIGSAIKKEDDTVIFQALEKSMTSRNVDERWKEYLRLSPDKKNLKRLTEYVILDKPEGNIPAEEYFIYSDTTDKFQDDAPDKIRTWARALNIFDSKLKEIMDGKIKLQDSTQNRPSKTEAL